MLLAVISPESDEPRESAVRDGLFADGLERYHVRKPGWTRERLAVWLAGCPTIWRERLVLHQHHELAAEWGCGGIHVRDAGADMGVPGVATGLRSRSCHTLVAVEAALGRYDAIFLSPLFPSISKPGYRAEFDRAELVRVLGRSDAARQRTQVLALGGVTADNAGRALDLGFDGVAVLGALWSAADPRAEFHRLQQSLYEHAG